MRRGAVEVDARDNPASYTPKHLAEKILTSPERARRRAETVHCSLLRHRRLHVPKSL